MMATNMNRILHRPEAAETTCHEMGFNPNPKDKPEELEYPSESSDALHDLRERLIECADEIAGIRAGFIWLDSIKARDSRLDRRLVNKRRRFLRHILRDLRRAISCESDRTETGRVSGTKDAMFEDMLEELLVVD